MFNKIKYHPWMESKVSIIRMMSESDQQGSALGEVRKEIVDKLKEWKMDFRESLNDQQIQEHILKRNPFSFVVCYELLAQKIQKKEEHKQQLILTEQKRNQFQLQIENQLNRILYSNQEQISIEIENMNLQSNNQGLNTNFEDLSKT
eukprot:TRINITY_DN6944_c0_g1_i3.p2 TRINITY_DN6944_c0_g1~~TRINITY_DN6944_c0_g1_i3.p2  ORF type:complete len:147 (+),score=26.34 TRINITY_DN6944_c0_g1_i3:357-797(+)